MAEDQNRTNPLKKQAEAGLAEIVEAIRRFVESRAEGARNDEVARELGLQTDVNGGQRNHLTHALLNQLVSDGSLMREKRGARVFYVAKPE